MIYAGLLFMAGCALTDLRSREVSLRFCGIFALLGLAALFTESGGIAAQTETLTVSSLETLITELSSSHLFRLATAFLPGLCLLLLSRLTEGGIGGGDGIAVLVSGFFFPLSQLTASLCAASLLSAVYAGIRFGLRRNRRESFPFLPFLLAGELLITAGQWTSALSRVLLSK